MAQVTRNPDDTFLVTLTTREQKTLQRWSNDPGTGPPIAPRSKAAQLEAVITAASGDNTSMCMAVHSHFGFRMLVPTYFQNVSICDCSSALVVEMCPLLVE